MHQSSEAYDDVTAFTTTNPPTSTHQLGSGANAIPVSSLTNNKNNEAEDQRESRYTYMYEEEFNAMCQTQNAYLQPRHHKHHQQATSISGDDAMGTIPAATSKKVAFVRSKNYNSIWGQRREEMIFV